MCTLLIIALAYWPLVFLSSIISSWSDRSARPRWPHARMHEIATRKNCQLPAGTYQLDISSPALLLKILVPLGSMDRSLTAPCLHGNCCMHLNIWWCLHACGDRHHAYQSIHPWMGPDHQRMNSRQRRPSHLGVVYYICQWIDPSRSSCYRQGCMAGNKKLHPSAAEAASARWILFAHM